MNPSSTRFAPTRPDGSTGFTPSSNPDPDWAVDETPGQPEGTTPDAGTPGRPGTNGLIPAERLLVAYSDSRLIMDGRVLQETMVLDRKATSRAGAEAPLALTPDSSPARESEMNGSREQPTDARDRARELSRETRREAGAPDKDRLGIRVDGGLGDDAATEDSILTKSFLSLEAESGTYTMVCIDGRSGQIKHTAGTYETQADRITFESNDGAIDPAARPSGAESPRPPSSSDPLDPEAPTGVAPARDPLSTPAPSDVATDGAAVDGARVDPSLMEQPQDRIGRVQHAGAPENRLRSTWAGQWNGAVRVVVDVAGPDRRIVTIYRAATPRSESIGANANADARTVTRTRSDEVLGTSTPSAPIICQAIYTRVTETDAAGARRFIREVEPLSPTARGTE
jgi:hypothetical protein